MKKFWLTYKPVIYLFLVWRLVLAVAQYSAGFLFPLRDGFLGLFSPWANLDGEHYISIAHTGYQYYDVAFFPFYPLVLRWFGGIRPEDLTTAGLLISHTCFFLGLLLFYKLLLPFGRDKAVWAILFLLAFPTSFFFAAVYSESLYFFLSIGCVYLLTQSRWLLAGVFGMLAGGTRLFGLFLAVPYLALLVKIRDKGKIYPYLFIALIPVGFLAYMAYLYTFNGDPLSFFHIQPAFGAGRTGGQLILLPQVLWRYLKILSTWQVHEFVYWIAVLELGTLIGSLVLLWVGFKKKINLSYLLYTAAIILLPTLTGTLSSLPRYALSAFPLFIILGSLHNTQKKYILVSLFVVLEFILTAAYLRGYFVA